MRVQELYKKYFSFLVEFGMQYICDRQAVEDIVMETIYRMHKRNYKEIPTEALLKFCVRNACLNYIKAKKRRNALEREYTYTGQTGLELIEEDALILIYQIIKQLPYKTSIVLELLSQGYSLAEISNKLNITQSTVRSLKKYGIDLIYKKLKGKL